MLKIFTCILAAQFFAISAVSAQKEANLLIVSGKGVAEIEPDMATITIGVSKIDFSAQQAWLENNEKMSRIIDELKKLGVARSDMKTTRFSIRPLYDYERGTGEKKFKGYRVSHNIMVKVRNLESIGKLLDQIVFAGATDLSGISFGVENSEELESIARKRAVENAHAKAIELAQAAGVSLGTVVRIEEGRYTPIPSAKSLERAEAAPIEPGTHRITATVTIHYLIE